MIKRQILETFEKGRIEGIAIISRRGIHRQSGDPTICLTHVKVTDGTQTIELDHAWLTLGKKNRDYRRQLKCDRIIHFTCKVGVMKCRETREVTAYNLRSLRVKEVRELNNIEKGA